MTDLWLLPLLGLCIGGVVTLFGGGGGVFYFLVLIAVVELPYEVAVPTSLATVVLTTAFGTYGHLRAGNVARRVGAGIVAGAVVGTYAGTRVVGALPTALLRRALGVVLLLVAASLLVLDHGRDDHPERPGRPPFGPRRAAGSVALGGVTGALSAVFGISGTPVLLPGLYALGLPASVVIGTSVLGILGVAAAGVGWYAALGGLDPVVTVAFGAGAAVGGVLAPRLLGSVPEGALESAAGPVFATVSALAGVGFLLGLL